MDAAVASAVAAIVSAGAAVLTYILYIRQTGANESQAEAARVANEKADKANEIAERALRVSQTENAAALAQKTHIHLTSGTARSLTTRPHRPVTSQSSKPRSPNA
jgi:hypothetical protein